MKNLAVISEPQFPACEQNINKFYFHLFIQVSMGENRFFPLTPEQMKN